MCSLAVETEMPGAELELPGPRYEPMSGVQPQWENLGSPLRQFRLLCRL